MNAHSLCLMGLAFALLAETGVASGEAEERLRAIEKELSDLPALIPSLQTSDRFGFHGVLGSSPAYVVVDLGRVYAPEWISIFPARLPVDPTGKDSAFPRKLRVEISEDPSFERAIRMVEWNDPNTSEAIHRPFLAIPGNGARGQFLRLRVLPDENDSPFFRLGEIVVLAKGRNVALRRPVESSESVEQARRWERQNLTDGYFWCLPLRGREESPSDGYHSEFRSRRIPKDPMALPWIEIDLGTTQRIDEVHLVPANPRGSTDAAGIGFPAHFLVLADPGTGHERIILDEAEEPIKVGEALPNPGATQVMIATEGLEATRIRLQPAALSGVGSSGGVMDYFLALSEIQVWQGAENLASPDRVRVSDTLEAAGWSPSAVADGHCSRYQLLDWPTWLAGIEQAWQLQLEAGSIRDHLVAQREANRSRALRAAIVTSALVALLAVIAIMAIRHQATRSREHLRQQIARDLHDEIGASLSHLSIQSDLAATQLKCGKLEPERLERISTTASSTIDNMRDVIWMLNPKAGDWKDFAQRIEAVAQRMLDGVESTVIARGAIPSGTPPIPWMRELDAFLKEALTNARRHSGANQVNVAFDWGSSLRIQIEDNGCGFDAISVAETSDGSGLTNLKSRASALRGELVIESSGAEGTAITLTVPLPKSKNS